MKVYHNLVTLEEKPAKLTIPNPSALQMFSKWDVLQRG